jgi:hypothetical protein
MHRRAVILTALLGAAASGDETPRKRETLLLLPEPLALRNELSILPAGARQTVLTPAREKAGKPGSIEPYPPEAFAMLGLSPETFAKRAAAAADKRLAGLKPDIIRNDQGRVLYVVYRGESEQFASLLVAPSLPRRFEQMLGKELWVALPDRHALYVFPAQSAALQEFTHDLASRYADDPFAASGEIFSLKAGEEPRVIASFVGEP